MARRSDMNIRYTFSVGVEIPDALDIGGGELAENITDAIFAYDDRHRLVNAVMEDGSETLLATSVGVEKVERVRDILDQSAARPGGHHGVSPRSSAMPLH